ncbi:hypothetical protein [Enhygromyxa salina]|uniref:hypothetical protein n=1 Tax=Enhygromyxa salina TaxID=215803 RepID=UPI0011BA70CF|nr:hypothetical protein [Enhygromyxa salina]
MAGYTVQGPFEVPVERLKGGRQIDRSSLPDFWATLGALAETKGCYTFGMKAARGYMPIYVGKATKSFRQECFGKHQRADHYNPALLQYLRATPMLFLVAQKTSRGKPGLKEIGELEKFLIQVGVARNPHLSNVHHTKQDTWSIDGVIRAAGGTSSRSSRAFKAMMKLK